MIQATRDEEHNRLRRSLAVSFACQQPILDDKFDEADGTTSQGLGPASADKIG